MTQSISMRIFDKKTSPDFNREIGFKILVRRKALGLTQLDLAERLLWSHDQVSLRERGAVACTVEELRAISLALGCSDDDLKP